ncbi:hypothetical protein ES319_A07G138600v1 [Gossypium barbadense]|uniref:Uncharacterized protein n=1 Tax=Gossypium barbadense TaxID=3634 RepID=A0A5J5V3G5_GOSBA|nr:hypothetical protein ES319_A07G138600v1 [Gossypium barbadense]
MASISREKKKAPHDDQNSLATPHKRKRSAALNVIKVALYMLRLKSSKSKLVQANMVPKVSWKRLLGSMRPMHIQSNQSPPPTIEAKPGFMLEPKFIPVSQRTEEDIAAAPWSPMASSDSSFMSQYESPLNQEIHVMEPSEEESWFDDDGGDEMIDAKAEEFIAQFYQQIRLQNFMNQ